MWDGDFQLSTPGRCVHKTLPPESLQSSDSIEALEPGSFVHKTDVFRNAVQLRGSIEIDRGTTKEADKNVLRAASAVLWQ
jgi:hypothetical protein